MRLRKYIAAPGKSTAAMMRRPRTFSLFSLFPLRLPVAQSVQEIGNGLRMSLDIMTGLNDLFVFLWRTFRTLASWISGVSFGAYPSRG